MTMIRLTYHRFHLSILNRNHHRTSQHLDMLNPCLHRMNQHLDKLHHCHPSPMIRQCREVMEAHRNRHSNPMMIRQCREVMEVRRHRHSNLFLDCCYRQMLPVWYRVIANRRFQLLVDFQSLLSRCRQRRHPSWSIVDLFRMATCTRLFPERHLAVNRVAPTTDEHRWASSDRGKQWKCLCSIGRTHCTNDWRRNHPVCLSDGKGREEKECMSRIDSSVATVRLSYRCS